MSDIERWLDEHGLGEYTELFVENKIDFDVLEQITPEELKELDIPLGDRKRMPSFELGLGGSISRIVRCISDGLFARSSSGSNGSVPVNSSYRSTPRE